MAGVIDAGNRSASTALPLRPVKPFPSPQAPVLDRTSLGAVAPRLRLFILGRAGGAGQDSDQPALGGALCIWGLVVGFPSSSYAPTAVKATPLAMSASLIQR
jgi:hypothetical protein